MKMLAPVVLSALISFGFICAPAFAQSQEYNGPAPRSRAASTSDQIIVKWRKGSMALMADPAAQRASKLSGAAGVSIQHKRSSSADTEVFKLSRAMNPTEMAAVLDSLNADPAVAFAVADQRRWAQLLPTDPLVNQQWYFLSVEAAATRAEIAWDTTTGSPATVVAVLDTGVRFEHPDLGRVESGGKLLAGYDFVADTLAANDGDGRDADATDPGDWVSATDRTQSPAAFGDCDLGNSSWHGTRVSSLIGALTNESQGLAGSDWNTQLLPVRVLGKCGGRDSDIIDAMRWSAGLSVAGVPTNTTPAKIINLSLGGGGACSAAYQAAVDEIIANGSLIVASVGNEGTVVSAPANCAGVLGVTGLRHIGSKVGFSNLGPGADIGAPGGNCVNTGAGQPCLFSILVANNTGTTTPALSAYTDQINFNVGTSFAAPLVAGAAALVHAANPSLVPSQISAVLQGSAMPFPTTSSTTTAICRTPTANNLQDEECICTTSTCGAGMLNTAAAVSAVSKPFGVVQAPTSITPNATVSIDGRNSFDVNGAAVATYQWSLVNVTGAMPTIADAAAAATTLQVSGDSQFTLRLRVTGAGGVTDDTDFAMVATTPIPPATTPIGSGGTGGGGGSFDWWLLVLGLLPLALPGPRRRKAARVRGRSMPRAPSVREALELNSASRSYRRRRRQHFPE